MKVIKVEGCASCPFCVATDDSDYFNGFKCICPDRNSFIGWTLEEFLSLTDYYTPSGECPLETLESLIKKENLNEKEILL